MKTPAILLLALAFSGAGRPLAAQPIPAPQPGAQPTQAPLLTPPVPKHGAARIMGLPGASATQTGGPPSVEAGERLAAKGAGAIAACAGCHGAQGEGMAATGFPRLAGQPAYYLGKQLAAYATGARVNPVMQPIAKAMSAQQIRDVSAYYAALGASAASAASAAMPQAGAGGPRGSERARTLDMVGDGARGVQACVNCHGPAGSGEPPIYPYLAGQHAAYLRAAMEQWKSGARSTDMSGQMPHIGRQLSAADVAALAAYYSALPAPPPAVQRINVPAGSMLRPAVAAAAGAPGPKAPGAAGVAGTGTEQGAPLTGGTGGGGAQGTQPPPIPPRPTPAPPDKR